jgi:hypothetical protein
MKEARGRRNPKLRKPKTHPEGWGLLVAKAGTGIWPRTLGEMETHVRGASPRRHHSPHRIDISPIRAFDSSIWIHSSPGQRPRGSQSSRQTVPSSLRGRRLISPGISQSTRTG